MPLTDSPSFEIEDSPNSKLPGDAPGPKMSFLRWFILLLGLTAGLLSVHIIWGPGNGSVSGSVRDIDGNPLQADVFIAGMLQPMQTDPEGSFFIANVPAGQHILSINHQGNTISFQVEIPKWDSLSIGQIQIDTSL